MNTPGLSITDITNPQHTEIVYNIRVNMDF